MEREPRSYVPGLDLRRELERAGNAGEHAYFWFPEGRGLDIQDHLLDSGMELISTRDFYPRQTALYMKWLANTRIATGVFSDIEF
jgi:hypothetical protein